MMLPLAFGWYGFQLLIFPLRFALYVLHGLMIFITKPGARFLIPAVMAVFVWWQWWWFEAELAPLVAWVLDEYRREFGIVLPPELHQWRHQTAAVILFCVATVLLMGFSRALRPVMGAFPAPSAPLRPHPPFVTPKLRIRRVPVRVCVTRLGASRIDSDPRALQRRMPPSIRALLESHPLPAGHYGGPSQISETKPSWPPLELQPATDKPAKPSRATAPKPAASSAATPKKTAARTKKAPRTEVYIPPVPNHRSRKPAAE